MDPEERLLWMKAMDEELEALSEREAVELAQCSEPLALGEQIVKSTWAF